MSLAAFSTVGVDFGSTHLFSNVTFTIAPGQRWGVVGRNGTGKTTIFRLLTGELEPSRGAISLRPGLRVSLLEQHRDFGDAATVWEAAAGGLAELLALERSLIEQAVRLAEDASTQALARYSSDLERFEREGGYAATSRIDAVLHGMGFEPASARSTAVSVLSGGERGRLGLVRQLVSDADLLLLDEPTNHLDLDTSAWLEEHLRQSDKTVMLVSHDRAFLASTVDHVLHLEGETAAAYAGGYQSFVVQRAERRLAQQRAFDQQKRKIEGERDYIARNIAGQNSRQAKGRRKRLERMPRLSPPVADEDAAVLRFDVAERGGDVVIAAKDATVAVGARVLISGLTGTVRRGDVLGLIGPNGSGKSTLLKALLGEHPLASGELRTGPSIVAGHYRQDLSQVPLDRGLYDLIAELRPHWERRLVQGHLGRFGFGGDQVQRHASSLSGGERARVALAMLMLSRANLLVLDEPTNHLDVESIEALEDAVERYDGTVVLVSHDRELLRALTTRLWVLHEQRITEFDGGFSEWESVSAERAHAAALKSSEEEALLRMHERQRTAPRGGRRPSSSSGEHLSLRHARARLDESEATVLELERAAESLSRSLADPALYARADGVSEARRLAAELDGVKAKLHLALERWAEEMEAWMKLSAE